MRPPPRKRRKPEHLDQPGPGPGPQRQKQKQHQQQQSEPPPDKRRLWLLGEQRNLLAGLKSLSKTLAAQSDIDYARLHKSVPTRTEEEVRSMLETLKSQVMSSARASLLKTWGEERRLRKPAETWTRLAAAVSGKLSQPISTAFSQMLIVSSTEPGTLMDSVPPVPNRPPTTPADGQGFAAAGKRGGTTPRRRGFQPVPKTPDSALAKTLPAPSQVVPVASPKRPQRQTSAEEGTSADATTSSAVTSKESASDSAGPEETPAPPVPPSTSTPAAPPTTPNATSATPPAALHAGSAGSSEPVTQDDSAMFNVSFEKIYCYLAAVHKPNQTCALTPMESAIVLDLLMSLPEEIPKLPCKQLRQHLIQVYQSLSAHADSKAARQMVENLRRRRVSAEDPPARDDAQRDQPPAHHEATVASRGEGQEAGGGEGSGHAHVMRLCPPLNPFMIPPKLLTRK